MTGFFGNCLTCGHPNTWKPETGIVCTMIGVEHE